NDSETHGRSIVRPCGLTLSFEIARSVCLRAARKRRQCAHRSGRSRQSLQKNTTIHHRILSFLMRGLCAFGIASAHANVVQRTARQPGLASSVKRSILVVGSPEKSFCDSFGVSTKATVDSASLSVALGLMILVWSMPSTGRIVCGLKIWQYRWPLWMKNFCVH